MAEKIMSVKEIETVISGLAKTQGFYGRLNKEIKNNRTILMEIKRLAKPKTALDIVLFLEG